MATSQRPESSTSRSRAHKKAERDAAQVIRFGQRTEVSSATADLNAPELYLNRELGLLEFNHRVLAQARDTRMPLLERLRFLTICCANLDEFYEIRVAGVKQQLSFELNQSGPDRMSAAELLKRISERAHTLVAQQYAVLNNELLPALAREGVHFLRRDEWKPNVRRWVRDHFVREVLPVLSPVGLDPAHPFPRVLNKSLNFIVSLDGADAFGRECDFAVVQAPRSLPRVVRLPRELARGAHQFVLLSSIIHDNVGQLFPGMHVKGCYQFRLTRNSDLWVDEEEVDDLLHALEGQLPRRNYGDSVRLEVADNCPPEIHQFLLDQFGLGPLDLFQVNGPVNLYRLARIYDLVDRADLKFAPFVPALPRNISTSTDVFDALRRGDLLLHHPYESFSPVVELIKKAAADPDVLAIKQTLYRTGSDSPIVDALIEAARVGKEVTAVVELRARFDEAANIDLATRLQEAGANVAYGVVGYKAHAKMLLIVRREGRRLRHYVHLGTGNYHARTARAYTDVSYLTANREIGEDVHRLFLQLTGLGRVTKLRRLLQSPFTLHKELLAAVEREIAAARAGRPARIVAKMNALSEPAIIRALYRASQAGVPIDLIVRGVCCLKPGIPGISDNIRVRSVVGRFLEHSRVFYFYADGAEHVWLSSADWMQRNFFRRVETAFPIQDPALKQRVIRETLRSYLDDNTQAWLMQSDGTYRLARGKGRKRRAAQALLLEQLAGS